MITVRSFSFAALFLLPAACGRPEVPARSAADEQAIRQLGSAFDDAWAHKDPHARASLFADDGSLINPFGQRAAGRGEIERVFASESQTIANGTTHRFGAMTIRFLDADRAMVDADNEIDGVPGPDGKQGAMKYHLVAIAERSPDGWKWLAGRPYAFLAPPSR